MSAHTAEEVFKGKAKENSGKLCVYRYGQYVKTFASYDSRDLHRLSKEDLVQVRP
jgi:hypothetical protein